MDLFNTISCAVAAAYEAVANRNRQAAVNNRLKAVVRSELATINRAYIARESTFITTFGARPPETRRFCAMPSTRRKRES